MDAAPKRLTDLVAAYDQMVQAIQDEELGWGLFLARKR